MSGAVTIAVQVRGTAAKPQAQGSIRLTNGEFRDDQTGFKLTGISGVIVANGDTVRIESLTGSTPNDGSIGAAARCASIRRPDFPGTIRVTGKHAQLVANSLVSATADLALTISGKLAQKPNVDGRITIVSMDITVPGRFSGVSAPIPGTKHLNPTPTARARLAQLASAGAATGRTPLFDATLTLRSRPRTASSSADAGFTPRSAAICTSPDLPAIRR